VKSSEKKIFTSESAYPSDSLVGRNNICEVLYKLSSFHLAPTEKTFLPWAILVSDWLRFKKSSLLNIYSVHSEIILDNIKETRGSQEHLQRTWYTNRYLLFYGPVYLNGLNVFLSNITYYVLQII
jgi:hypothetical protein